MIGKSSESDDESAVAARRVNVVSERRKLLQETSANVQDEVRLCFEQLARVLRTREKQLLRQVQAVHNQQLTILQSDGELAPSIPSIKVNLSRRQELQDCISKFGELVSADRSSIVVGDAEPYKIEEYVQADKDHISFDKSIKIQSAQVVAGRSECLSESLCDLSLDASSEADVTLDNEITVIMNHNYSSSSDGLGENPTSSEKNNSDSTEENNPDSLETNNSDSPMKNHSESTEKNNNSDSTRKNNSDSTEKNNSDSPVKNYSKEFNCYEERKVAAETKENPSSKFDFSAKDINDSSDCTLPTEASSTIKNKAQECEQHPKQIQQWLQQILVETETEPTIHEVEQFAEISKSRFKEFQFPLET